MINRMVQNTLFITSAMISSMMLYWWVDLIHRGGPVMIPILVCSMFALGIIIERLWYFFTVSHEANRLLTELRPLIQHQRWQEAVALCEMTGGPLTRVVRAGLAARDQTSEEIEKVMEESAHEELPAIERHHRWLSTIAQVSTLLGLLGTVTGMVAAFQVIQNKATAANPVNPGDLAGGIWEALITTVAGLEVAIPTILAYNYLVSRVVELQFQMERASAIVAGWRHRKSWSGPTPAPAASSTTSLSS